MINTITFDEKVKGFTSFHSFIPEWMIGMNNEFFSFKNGELYLHHSDNVDYNEYYGETFDSKISVMFNDSPSDVKELQAVSLEGNYAWNIEMKAYISNIDDFTLSTLTDIEFVEKEGFWYTYARRNEDTLQLDSKSIYGIGRYQSENGSDITISGHSPLLTSNDNLLKDDLSIIGTVQSFEKIDDNTTLITVSAYAGGLALNDFILGNKDARIEGGNLRGYTMRFDLQLYKPDKIELFAVNSEVMKSFP